MSCNEDMVFVPAPKIDWDDDSVNSEFDKFDLPEKSSGDENKFKKSVVNTSDDKDIDIDEEIDETKSLVPYYQALPEETPSVTDWIVDMCLYGRRRSILGKKKQELKNQLLQQLEQAVSRSPVPEIRKILDETTGPIPGSVVLRAMTSSRPDIAELLLNTKRVNDDETSPLLMYIALQSKKSLWKSELRVARLLEADVNVVGDNGETPVYAAVRNGNFALAKFLLEEQDVELEPSPQVKGTPVTLLYDAVTGDQAEKMVELLSDYINLAIICPSDDTNALHWLTARKEKPFLADKVRIARILLDHGASLDLQSKHGLSPLHQAVKINDTELVSLYLDHECNSGQMSWKGYFPLYFAVELEDPSPMINLLVQRRAYIDQSSYTGASALHRACELYNEKAIRSLLENGADVNMVDENGRTPLEMMLPRYRSKFEAVKPVIEKIARLELEKQPIYEKNLDIMDGIPMMQDYFDKCRGKKRSELDELRRMLNLDRKYRLKDPIYWGDHISLPQDLRPYELWFDVSFFLLFSMIAALVAFVFMHA